MLPTRDRPEFLAEAVASVLAQRGVSWELVVVDDGSATPATVPADPRVHLVRLADSAGSPARARNVGLAHATAEVVAFLDDDDQFAPERLAVGLRAVEDGSVAVCGSRFLDETTNGVRCLDGDVADTILDGYTPCLGATTVRHADCPGFDERWQAIEDVDWWWRTAQRHPVVSTRTVGDHGLARRLLVTSLRSHPSARTAWQLRRALPLRRAS